MTTSTMAPVHPGEVLLEEFLEPMEISQCRLTKDGSLHELTRVAHDGDH